jgi:RNA polymerase sigma factor (TIGR02999 family)
MSADRHEITSLLRAWTRGDAAAGERLFPLVYDSLRQMARRQRRGVDADQTLSTTGLVHEAYLRLVKRQETGWRDRAQFFALASKVMRAVLVDQARRRQASKRGGDRVRVTLLDGDAITEDPTEEILTVHDALKRLEEEEPRRVRVVECRFFGGLAVAETAEALGVSVRTVEREWREARLYLYRALRPDRFGDDHS